MDAIAASGSVLLLPDDRALLDRVGCLHDTAITALEALNEAVDYASDAGRYVSSAMLHDALASCRIEGLDVPWTDMRIDAGRPVDTRIIPVVRCSRAMEAAFPAPLSIRLLERTDSMILGRDSGIRGPGEQVYLVDPTTGAVFSTPPPGDRVPELLEQLLSYIGDEGVDPLVRIAVGHAVFEAIHPFMDGNGRTGRILIEKLLVDLGLLEMPVLQMSASILDVRRDYNRELRRIAEGRAAWDGWMRLFLDCIERSCKGAQSIIDATG